MNPSKASEQIRSSPEHHHTVAIRLAHPTSRAPGLVLSEVWRLVGLILLFEYLRDSLPAAFAIPAGVGDILAAITAPAVYYGLKKGGARSWATALVWCALGIADLVYAVTLGLLTNANYILTSYVIIYPTVFVPVAATTSLVTIWLLLKTPPI